MGTAWVRSLAFLILVLASAGNASGAPPSHCTASEYAVVDAWMGDVVATPGGWRNTRRGKLLSLCADRREEPFQKLTYRYGAPGQVELTAEAKGRAKFFVASTQTSPRTGDDLVFFKKGHFTYYIAMATGQGHGVSLMVFQGKHRLVTDRFSGNYEGEDFSMGPARIDFISVPPRSRILIPGHPEHKVN